MHCENGNTLVELLSFDASYSSLFFSLPFLRETNSPPPFFSSENEGGSPGMAGDRFFSLSFRYFLHLF